MNPGLSQSRNTDPQGGAMNQNRFLLTACAAAIATTSFGFISRAFLIAERGQILVPAARRLCAS